jgi:raffinose/stachyose/melibiose transport system substrate-binding protein
MNNDQNLSLSQTTEYWRIQNLVATGELDPADAGAEFQKFIDQQG